MQARPGEMRSAFNAALAVGVASLAAAFLIGFGARPAILLSHAGLDDALFVRLARSLAAGQWLGPYDHTTLVKGPGFPAFLTLNNLAGLPYPVGVALFHLACSGFVAWVVARLLLSRLAGVALFAALLIMPPIYAGDLMRVNRELFYTSLTIGFLGAALALASGRGMHRGAAAVLAGGLFAWTWLSREEGVWLLPAILILALAPLFAGEQGARPARPRLRQFAPMAAAALVAVLGVAAVAAANEAVYGRFVINEIKDPVFQDALDALQEASAPYRQEMLPVPKAARAQIYAVSPAFAELREPVLDGPQSANYTTAGCMADRRTCGDLGGGWFLWAFREAAALKGHHRSLRESRAYYRKVTAEVRQACAEQRLTCKSWNVPLVPPMSRDQVDDVGASILKGIDAVTFGVPVGLSGERTDLSAADGPAMYNFLNRPAVGDTTATHAFKGWFKQSGSRWFQLIPAPDVRVERFTRKESPDLAVWFKDPGVTQHRYELRVTCPGSGPCPARLQLEDGSTFDVDLTTMHPGPHRFGPAELYVDDHSSTRTQLYLKDAWSKGWVSFASGLNVPFRILLLAGAAAFLFNLGRAILARRLSLSLVVATALLASVAVRILILALIDALSFPAANASYGLAAVPLLLIATVVALHEALSVAGRAVSRRPAAA